MEGIFVSGELLAALGGSVIFAPHFRHFEIGRFVEDDRFFAKSGSGRIVVWKYP